MKLDAHQLKEKLTIKAVRNVRRGLEKDEAARGMYRPGVKLDLQRSRLVTESYRQTEGEPMVIRRAKALANVLSHMDIYIQDWERIVGNNVSTPQGLYFGIDMNWRSVKRVVSGEEGKSLLNDAEREELAEMIASITGYPGEIQWDTSKPDGQPRRCLDTSRAKQEFGFQAKVDFNQGIDARVITEEIGELGREIRMKEVIVLDILIIILFLTATASLSIARLSINTSIDLGQEYNNNIFLDPAVKEDDFITTVFPTLELQYVRSKYLNIELEYGLRYLFYRHHSELNDTGTKETQNAQLQAQIKPSDNLLIDISDIYERVPVDIRREVAEGNVFFNKTERNTFTVSSSMTLRMTPFVTQTIGYRYINVWQGDDDLVDLIDTKERLRLLTRGS